MAISGVSSSGIMSGINAGDLISQIMAIEERPIALLQNRQTGYDLKISSILSLSTKLGAYNTALKSLNNSEKFNTVSASVSKTSGGAELLSVSASSAASVGNYEVKVNQIASASKKSAQGWVDKNTTAIASAFGTHITNGDAAMNELSNMTLARFLDLNEIASEVNAANATPCGIPRWHPADVMSRYDQCVVRGAAWLAGISD